VPKVAMNIAETCSSWETSYYAYDSNYDYQYRYGTQTRCWSEDFFETTYDISGTVRAPVDTMEFTASTAGLGSTYYTSSSFQQDGDWQPYSSYYYTYSYAYDNNFGVLQGSTDTVSANLLWQKSGETVPTVQLDLDVGGLQNGLVAWNGLFGTMELDADVFGQGRVSMSADVSSKQDGADMTMYMNVKTKDEPCYLTMAVCAGMESEPAFKLSANMEMNGADAQVRARLPQNDLASLHAHAGVEASLTHCPQSEGVLSGLLCRARRLAAR
jgi:hypothetical protein